MERRLWIGKNVELVLRCLSY